MCTSFRAREKPSPTTSWQLYSLSRELRLLDHPTKCCEFYLFALFIGSLSYISRISARVCITFSPTWLLFRRGLSPHRLQRRAKSRQSWSRVSLELKIETSRSTTTRGKLFINEIVTLHKLEIICEVGNQMRAIFTREFKTSRSKKSSLKTNRAVKSLREMCFNYFYSTEPIDFMVEWKIAGELAIGARLLRTAKRKLENCKIIFSSFSLPHNQKARFVFI